MLSGHTHTHTCTHAHAHTHTHTHHWSCAASKLAPLVHWASAISSPLHHRWFSSGMTFLAPNAQDRKLHQSASINRAPPRKNFWTAIKSSHACSPTHSFQQGGPAFLVLVGPHTAEISLPTHTHINHNKHKMVFWGEMCQTSTLACAERKKKNTM